MRPALLFLALIALHRPLTAAGEPLLHQAVQNWLGERDHWAFTQRAIEYDNGQPRERLERYDPSRLGNARWQLLAINGRPPTPEERAAWEKRKFKKKRKKFDSPLGEFFDFERARVLAEDAKTIRFGVPLRGDKNWLFPTDKVDVTVAINKETRALEHLSAHVREPFKVLLGIARVTGGSLDLEFDEEEPTPSLAQPNGKAQASVLRLGERVDFTWSDFKRVTPPPNSAPAP
ncbi:MAG: hypothetical protein RIQ93_707 [Verrucomicrobiota bacterium]|jgi:hypothetical protein